MVTTSYNENIKGENMNIKAPNLMFSRPLINIGMLSDIPTGSFITGPKGESILNGGLSGVTGMVGTGNRFKSTLVNYMMLSASDRMCSSGITAPMHTYDTEDNMSLNVDRINSLAERFVNIPDDPLYDQDVWSYISKSSMTAEEWLKLLYEAISKKMGDKKLLVTYDSFYDRVIKAKTKLIKPSFVAIDSLTELESSTTANVVVDGNIESSNTVFMQQGLFKTKLLKDMPRMSNKANIYFFLTAHVGKEIDMASGPYAPKPTRSLQFIKQGDKIKGVSDKLYFLTSHLWQSTASKPLINPSTREPEYPLNEKDNNTDLNIVSLVMLRSKSGPSGISIDVIVSQREGLLPALSEFHYIKTMKYGLEGNLRSYALELYPECKLSRTTVRKKIDADAKLRRALNITAELLQMTVYMKQYSKYFCTPKELYEGLKSKGYDWDDILEHTRGWWTIKNYDTESKFLSTLDLLKMNADGYKPFWLKDKKGK